MANIIYSDKEHSEEVDYLPNCDIRTHTISELDGEPHSHSFYELFYVLEGSIIHSQNGDDRLLSIGDLVILRPNCDTHYFKRIANTTCTHRDILFTDSLFRETCEFLGIEEKVFFYGQSYQKRFPVKLGVKDIEHFERIVRNILYYNESDGNKQRLLVRYFLVSLLSAALMIETDNLHIKNFPAWFNEFLSLFKKADIIKKGLPELKKHMPYSYEHVGRVHKEFMGKTIVEHLTEVRMSYAATLLTTTNLSMLSIAMEIGYNSLSHFNRMFNKCHGLPPYLYKKQKQVGNNNAI